MCQLFIHSLYLPPHTLFAPILITFGLFFFFFCFPARRCIVNRSRGVYFLTWLCSYCRKESLSSCCVPANNPSFFFLILLFLILLFAYYYLNCSLIYLLFSLYTDVVKPHSFFFLRNKYYLFFHRLSSIVDTTMNQFTKRMRVKSSQLPNGSYWLMSSDSRLMARGEEKNFSNINLSNTPGASQQAPRAF